MTVKETAQRFPQSLIGRAYRLAERAHVGQKRKTGDPYFTHPLATAEILNSWHLDEASIAAGLLHDVVEDTIVARDEVLKDFGPEIMFLVDGVTKLSRVKYRGTEGQVENLRKMILALSQDLRVLFLKLADRLHNMRTLAALPPQKQKRIALESDEIYAPLAHRLGMQGVAGELHDLAFPFLHPKEARWLRSTTAAHYESRLAYLKRIAPQIEKALKDHGITPLAVDFRAKRYASLYQKLKRYDMNIERIYDLVAMRIIVSDVATCYAALGAIHQAWPPLPGRIKDYIAMPKPNGYRSLHTTIIGPDQKFVEIQIRTKEMHEENENGIAAHWLYEQRKSGGIIPKSPKQLTEEVKWVQQLRRWQEKFQGGNVDSNEFLESMKIDFLKDRIFAITPYGDIIVLPAGSTPVDFAYHIHSEIGDTCVAAKVNDRFVPLNYELQSGEMVEILTQKNKRPSQDWLQFVKTGIAKDHIKAAAKAKRHALSDRRAPIRTELKVFFENDRPEPAKAVTAVIARSHINILEREMVVTGRNTLPLERFIIGTNDKAKIEKTVAKIKKVPGVRNVEYEILPSV
ncbi:MAG TPA: RelA/SpoT family protein [Candidatus Paceibacterota bacterium]|nr:RelA/SpoT family protein [Candidatus Paceibacterota bacterium]